MESDFDLENVPALAFAARATSSFPGAFPPAQLVEMDGLVASRGVKWLRRKDLLADALHIDRERNAAEADECDAEFFFAQEQPPRHEYPKRTLVWIDPTPFATANPTRLPRN